MTDEVVYPLIINNTNLVSNGYNNTYRYSFPAGSVQFKNSKVAVSTVSIYYSWFNITSSNGNNSFQFIWPTSSGTTTYTVTLTDGFYAVSDINSYFQQFCITNGLYLVNTAGQNVYYLEFVTNSNYYSVQVNAFPLPTALPTGWSNPGAMTFPATGYTPQLIILSSGFTNIIGFMAGTYPSVQRTSTYSVLSTYTPEVSPTQSIILAFTLVNNQYSNPRTVLYSFSPAGTTFGSLIESSAYQYAFVDIQDGNYSTFDIIFLDQNFSPLRINDANVCIQLLIKSSKKGISY